MMRLTCAFSSLVLVLGLAACVTQPGDDDDDDTTEIKPFDDIPDVDPLSCDGVPEGMTSNLVFYETAAVPYGEICEPREQLCTCSGGQWACLGELVETACEVMCPDGTTRVGGTSDEPVCECSIGYVFEDGACVRPCPDNSQWDESNQACTCVPNYFVDEAGTACVPGDQLCPEFSHHQPEADGQLHCQCDDGYVVNFDRDACVPPGEECPAGRPKMVVNNVTIICCPPDAEAVSYSSSTGATCICPAGKTYDASSNECS